MNPALFGAVFASTNSMLRAGREAKPRAPRPGYWPVGRILHTPFGKLEVGYVDGPMSYMYIDGEVTAVRHSEGVHSLLRPSLGLASTLTGMVVKARPHGFTHTRGWFSSLYVKLRWWQRELNGTIKAGLGGPALSSSGT